MSMASHAVTPCTGFSADLPGKVPQQLAQLHICEATAAREG